MSKTVKWTTIINIAKKVKEYVEKNKKLPATVTIGDVKYTWSQIWYILSWAINNLNKDLESVTSIASCTGATGDSINEKIYPSDFRDQAKRVVQYIKQNGKSPNFVTSVKSKKKIRPRLSVYAEAKIIVWYHNNKNTFPKYCIYDSSVFSGGSSSKSKHGHATVSGCDNRGQNNGVYCAPHSMQEVIRNLTGKVIPQSTLASWAGTGSGGTGHSGIETAIAKAAKQLGVTLTCKWYNFSDLGWEGINKILKSSNQDCIIHNLYRNQWGHYEVINSISGSNVKVQNSLGSYCSRGCYCGYVEDRSTSEFRSYISGISQKSVLVVTRG